MNDASGTTTWAYDALGRVVTNIQARAGAEMRYSFDVEGRRAQMLVDDRAVVYGYDHAGRLEVVDDDAVALGPMQYVWDAQSGRMKEILLPGGAKISMAHDSVGRLTSRAYHGRFGQTLASVAYTHDKAGQRVTEAGNRGSLSFDYDEKRQLIRAEGVTGDGGSPQEYNYSFDPIGNWLTGEIGEAGASEPIAKEFTANAVNQYTEIEVLGETVTPQYDLNGNMTSDGQRLTMAWDMENRLAEVRASNTRSVFIYDGLGKRVERREYATTGMGDPGTLTETVRYVYDGLLPVEERIWNGAATGAPAKVRKLTRGLDLSGTLEGAGGIGGLLAFTSGGQSTFYFSDGNGNVTHLLDAADQLKAEYKYDPFGNRLSASGPMAEESAWQWSGKEFHEASGLVYYLYRYFSPNLGRWVNRDPIEESGGVDLYAFVQNNPCGMIDPYGHDILPTVPDGPAKKYRDKLENTLRNLAEGAVDVIYEGPFKTHQGWRDQRTAVKAAESAAKRKLPKGQQNAMRHCVWSCELCRSVGREAARKITRIHEARNIAFKEGTGGWEDIQTIVDEHNNTAGEVASKGSDSCECECNKLMERGLLDMTGA